MRWMVLPAVLAALVLALAGCGGSGSSSDASGTDEVTTEETETTEDSTVTDAMEDEDSTATDEDSSSSEDTSGIDLSGSGLSDDCQDLVEASAAYAEAFGSIGSGGELDLQSSADALEAVANAAPAEIQEEFQTLAQAVAAYAEALEGVDLSSTEAPDPETLAKITAASQAFSGADVAAASEAIGQWTTENCSGVTP